MKTKRILCLFDYNSRTGFSKVSHNIKKHIKAHFGDSLQLDICAINYHGEPYEESDGTSVISAAKSAPKHDDFGRYGFLKLLKEFDYDGIFIMQDLAVMKPIYEIIAKIKADKAKDNKKRFKSIYYFPVDCHILPRLVKGIEVFDCLVTYTEYGRDKFLLVRPDLKDKLYVIEHGVEVDIFKPLGKEEVMRFRKDYFKCSDDTFIVTNVNRNQARKDIPKTIAAFKEFSLDLKRRGEKTLLYLHMNPKDPMGWDLKSVCEQIQLIEGEDIMFPENDIMSDAYYTPKMLNWVYNASNLYITTTLGEGWGLTFHEAAAAKCPIVAPFNTSLMEMSGGGDRAFMYDVDDEVCLTADNILRQSASVYDITMALNHAYDYLQRIKGEPNPMVEVAYNWATSLDWKYVCKKWVDRFKEVY